MKFTKHLTYSQYFTCAEHKHVLFFCKELPVTEIEANEIFQAGFSKNFAFLFLFDEYNDSILKESIKGLESDVDDFPRRLWWIESYNADKIVIKNRPSLSIVVQMGKLQGIFNNFSFQENFKFNTNGNSPIISFLNNNIQIESQSNIELLLDKNSIGFKSAVIKLDKANCGVLNFTNIYKENLIQPTSSYFNEASDRIAVHYFDKHHYNVTSEIEVFYFPYPNKSIINGSKGNEYATKFKISNKKLKTNIVDELGNQAILNDELSAYVAFTEYKEGDIIFGPYYHFMPLGQAELEYPGDNLLLGFNGTETTSGSGRKVVLDFKKNDQVKVSGDLLLKSLNSWTSQPQLKSASYNLDSEKSPLFKNDKIESNYTFIKKADISEPLALPIIPTLSFKDNPDLIELEEVFKKVRLERIKKQHGEQRFFELAEPHITPQGFLKTSGEYDFIKPPKPFNKGKAKKNTEDAAFQFKLLDSHGDIDLSIRKDQVFLVLTPELFRQYILQFSDTHLEAFFQVNRSTKVKFNVDLSSIFPNKTNAGSQLEHSSFIIFKFHREKMSSLIEDVTKWTNHGEILSKDKETIKQKLKIAKDFEDPYFKESILEDENWNGVVILNIPITDSKNLPAIFTGLSSSQDFFEKKPGTISLETKLRFQYAAFPLNKTGVEEGKTSVEIKSTSFYGLIDYNPFAKGKDGDKDYKAISDYFDNSNFKFVLSKLLVRFRNSSISEFKSIAFLQIHSLFDDAVSFDPFKLSNDNDGRTDTKPNLIRLVGSYQENSAGEGEIRFNAELSGVIKCDASILKEIKINRVGFICTEKDKFKFDIDARPVFNKVDLGDYFSFDGLELQNIGLSFQLPKLGFPDLKFDLSSLIVIPQINFNGKGFLKSFPISFSRFQNFRLPVIKIGTKYNFADPEFDFFKIKFDRPKDNFDWPDWNPGLSFGNLLSFVFDFDLGNLGNLDALKALKGQLLIGWSFKGGFAIGFKLASPGSKGIHLDLFGAIKLDIETVDYGKFPPPKTPADCTAYFLRLVDARLNIFGLKLPGEKDKFNGLIISDPSSPRKIAWEINLLKDKKLFVFGQGVGPDIVDAHSTIGAIEDTERAFKTDLSNIPDCKITPKDLLYNPQRNYLIALKSILPEDWPIQLSTIFNDPDIYGIYLGFKGEFLKGFSIDILYKKLSENLGVYSLELQLPDSLRNYELGGAFIKLPNIGIDIFTNGDWKTDIGFPINGNDWSRSGFIQLRTAPPFVGWFGFYMMVSKVASLTLFKGYIPDTYSTKRLQIIQAGFAMRVGIGFYFDKGILFVGASITVYGILEGAFAFEKEKTGLSKLLPDHFAVLGRVGAMAELVGYVDFGIIKASVYISLRVEFGLLLVYLGRDIIDVDTNKLIRKAGIQPVKIYVEGEVRVQVSIKIGCIKIHLSFGAHVRFEFTIGGNGGNSLQQLAAKTNNQIAYANSLKELTAPISIDRISTIPIVYLPAFSRVKEINEQGKYEDKLLLIHTFMIPFLGLNVLNKSIQFPEQNILKDKIILPFLQELIEKVPLLSDYETLRHFLLTGKVSTGMGTEMELEIKFPNYLPTLVHGINSSEKDVVTNILTSEKFGFGFAKDDVKPNPDKPNDYSIINVHQKADANSLLVIPVPISSNIQIVSHDYDPNNPATILAKSKPDDPTKANGDKHFDIEIDGLVADVLKNPKISKQIKKDRLKKEDKDYIDTYYDSYKTQFIGRQNQLSKIQLVDEYDKRDDIMIPEFFKLTALLTIERFHQFATKEYRGIPKVNYKESDSISPLITIKGVYGKEKLEFAYKYDYIISNEDGTTEKVPLKPSVWSSQNINNELENIAGQVNYFYNNGLRLPLKDKAQNTKSIFEFVDQYNAISLSDPIPSTDTKDIKVNLAGYDITLDVFADDAAKTNMRKFVEGFKPGNFNFDKIKDEFIRKDQAGNPLPDLPIIQFPDPFNLIPISLSIQNSKLSIVDKANKPTGRFFDIPSRLAQHGTRGQGYSFKLNYADYKKQNADGTDSSVELGEGDGVLKCLNIEIKVKRHEDGDKKSRVLEINNVYVDDLNLMYSLFNGGDNVNEISFYYKQEKDFDQANPLIKVQKLNDIYATLLKTNLSPRTSPPLFPATFVKKMKVVEEPKYWADSNTDKKNFIRLLWEGLTTNSGGYYIVMDNDEIPEFKNEKNEKVDTGTIILSFVAANQDQIPYYFNSIKIDENEAVFNGLKDKSHYLFIDDLSLIKSPTEIKKIYEYHPVIPAHSMSFELKRDKSVNKVSNYENYLPLEFELYEVGKTGNLIEPAKLNCDNVLPLMPTSELNDDKQPQPDRYIYNHLTPLVIQKDEEGKENYSRYEAVGKTYQLKINVRDVFGFRTNEAKQYIASQNYTHHYFDKIIPIESWPLINFSFWLNEKASKENLLFDIICNHNILEILDLAGIPKQPDGTFKYNLGDDITDSKDFELLKVAIKDFSDNLNTIIAQLNDSNLSVKIEDVVDKKRDLKKELKELLQEGIKKNFEIILTGKIPTKDQIKKTAIFPILIKAPITADILKKELIISILLTRKKNRLDSASAKNIFKKESNIGDLNSENVWDYESVYKSVAKIKMFNTKEVKKSTMMDLNDAIRNATNAGGEIAQYCLGIASEESTGKIIYLVNEGKLAEIKVSKEYVDANKLKQDKCYFGIKPFSNKLWSGEYKPSYKGAPENFTNFSNIDLDKALKIILAKIDELLYANKISKDFNGSDTVVSEEIKGQYQKLITAKKLVTDKKLKGLLGFVDSKDDSVSPTKTLVNEFRELLLSGLTKFYAYDGIVSTKLDVASLKILDAADLKNKHRVSINLKTQNDYNIVSSKVGYSRVDMEMTAEWNILFDQKDNQTKEITFDIDPEITHMEYDISIPQDNIESEIEHSTWVQLIRPVKLKAGKYSVRKWPIIKREFPDKPVILKHVAEQSNPDNGIALGEWQLAKVGRWYYELEFKNSYEIETDIIEIKFEIKNAGESRSKLFDKKANFEGFIAFWAGRILEVKDFKSSEFISDFYLELKKEPSDKGRKPFADNEKPGFIIKKKADTKIWDKDKVTVLDPNKVFVTGKSGDPTIKIEIRDFNIFEADVKKRVVSILPILKVYRNPDIINARFQYETESVRPVTPVTPHIKYFNPIALKGKFENEVFNQIPLDIPFKATAKYLIDTAGESYPKTIKSLPTIPVQQIECNGNRPSSTDTLFTDFDKENGFQAFSITLYNKSQKDGEGHEIPSENDLPIFFIDTLFKIK